MKIIDINGYALSSKYGDGNNFGQPLGVKSIGIIEIKTDNDIIGFGETYSGVYVPELIKPVIEFIKPNIIGLNPINIEEVINKINIPFITDTGLFRSIISAIDIALWDIKGQAFEKPIAALLNEKYKKDIKVYASGGSVAMDNHEIENDVQNILNKGFKAYKMRVGFKSFKDDLLRIESAKNLLGDNNSLMIDAIMGTLNKWDLNTAITRENEFKEFNIDWLEEPLHPGRYLDYQKLRKVSNSPIAIGESFTSINEFESYISGKCLDIIQPDITHCGGFTEALKILNIATKNNTPIAMHVWGSPISIQSNLHFAIAFDQVQWLEIPQVKLDLLSDIINFEKNINDGSIKPELKPGLGISITEEVKNECFFVKGSGYKIPS